MKLYKVALVLMLLLGAAGIVSAATYSFTDTTHHTLVLNVVDTATGTANCGGIGVYNRSATADIFVRVDGANPAARADSSWLVPPNTKRTFFMVDFQAPMIKLISSVAADYSLECE